MYLIKQGVDMNKEWISALLVISLLGSGYLGKVINDKNNQISTLNDDMNKSKEVATKEITIANNKILQLEKEKENLLKTSHDDNMKIKELESLIKAEEERKEKIRQEEERKEKIRQEQIKAEEEKKRLLKNKTKVSLPKELIPMEIKTVDCVSPNKITDDMEIVIAGGYSGKRLPESIDLSGHTANLMDVYVDNTEKEVVLLLSAYEPTIWNIYKTNETKINQVVLTGYYEQNIKGLDLDVPVLYRDRNTIKDSSCISLSKLQTEKEEKGDGRYRRPSKNTANNFSNELFGRDINQRIFPKKTGIIFIGNENSYKKNYYQNASMKIEDFYLEDRILSGPDGLEQLVGQNKMKSFNQSQAMEFLTDLKSKAPKKDEDYDYLLGEIQKNYLKVYLVVDDMRFPSGLSAMHVFRNDKYRQYRNYLFIIDKGVSLPTGSKGHAIVMDLNDKNFKD